MQIRTLFIVGFFVLLAGAGCNNKIDDIFKPVEIPPLTMVADSLYTESQSGLKYYDLQVGTGAIADDGYVVEFHFILWLEDGTLVQSSYLTNRPQQSTMGNGSLSDGWNEALRGMRTGGYRQAILPPEIGYGEAGSPSLGIPPNSTVVIEFALTGVGIDTGV